MCTAAGHRPYLKTMNGGNNLEIPNQIEIESDEIQITYWTYVWCILVCIRIFIYELCEAIIYIAVFRYYFAIAHWYLDTAMKIIPKKPP
jgi:hypothetical protein